MIVNGFFQKAARLNVFVIGDVMIDRYLTGRVNRISPEAPVPVVAQAETENRLGGAANVALNVQAAGAAPFLFGAVGKDADSSDFFALMARHQLNGFGLLSSAERPTTVKTRIIADRQHLLRLDREITTELSRAETARFCALLEQQLDRLRVDVIILQDYNKGVLSPEVIGWILKAAKKRSIPVAVDPKLNNFFAFKGVQLFKPNLKEVRDALKKNILPDLPSLIQATGEISAELNHESTLVTLSERGVFYSENGKAAILPTRPRKVADVCGAGDAVISIAAIGLALGLELKTIALLSNLVGGQVVEKLGVVPLDKEQLRRELPVETLAS